MTPTIVILILFIWHIWWNVLINDGLNSRLIYKEQVAVSFATAILLEWISEWNIWLCSIVVVWISIVYYLNIIHIRFFGKLIGITQFRQFFSERQAASVNASMVLIGAVKLARPKDMINFGGMIGVLIVLFISHRSNGLWSETARWGIINIFLLVLILLTFLHAKSLREGAVLPHRFGLFIAFCLGWKEVRRREFESISRASDALSSEAASSLPKAIVRDQWFGKYKGKNVIMIQLESFQQFVLHHKAEGQEITPFLNSLARNHMEFTDIFSQHGMGHTADAELSVLQSLYPHQNEIVNYKHFDKNFMGLPSLLRKQGYSTSAFHGYKGDFYNRRTMMKIYGFDHFFSEEEYTQTEKILFGLSDRSFFEQTFQKMKEMKQPFFSFLITLTSHYPYNLEKEYQQLNFQALPENLANYYHCLNYTDRALQLLFKLLKNEKMLEDTIVVLYGDHEGVHHDSLSDLYSHLGLRLSNSLQAEAHKVNLAKVPFIIVNESQQPTAYQSNTCGSTLDIGQTLLHLLGVEPIEYGFGESLFSAAEDRIVPLTSCALGSFASSSHICIASPPGAIVMDREKQLVSRDLTQQLQTLSSMSTTEIMRSQSLLQANLLNSNEQTGHLPGSSLSFSLALESLIPQLDDESIIIPLFKDIESDYLIALNNDLKSLENMQQSYSEMTGKMIRFHTLMDYASNDRPIYFEDVSYFQDLINYEYRIKPHQGIRLTDKLRQLPDHVLIIVAAKDEASSQFDELLIEEMKRFGFNQLNESRIRNSYINLIYKNKGFFSLYEAITSDPLECHYVKGTLLKGIALSFDLDIVSKGAFSGNYSSIKVDELECSLNMRGLNIAVIDMETAKLISSFRVDTFITSYLDQTVYVATKGEVSIKEG